MQVALTGGFYEARGLIADAQRCVNLYPERNPEDAPYPFTHYLTPGLTLLGTAPTIGCRCLYMSGYGNLYGVYGNTVYYISPSWSFLALGTIGSGTTPVSLSDNLLLTAIVDGSGDGWYTGPGNPALTPITDTAFLGGDFVDYLDTFMIFNVSNSNQWFISASNWSGNNTSGPVLTGAITTAGSGYTNGVFPGVALTGGSGTGAAASITVAGNVVTSVVISDTTTGTGQDYLVGDVLSCAGTALAGGLTGGNVAAGAGYVNATYTGIPLTGGTGAGGVATIVVAGKIVTTVTITTEGSGYSVGDVLSAPVSSIGGSGSGFSWTVTSITAGGTGFSYTVDTIGLGTNSFDPLAIASITGASDELSSFKVMHREIWLLGQRKGSEVWYDSGAADFPFQAMPGVFVEHGCIAKYSLAKADVMVFWLGQDKEGQAVVYRGFQYHAERISTFAIENEIQAYATISDAVGFTYQQEGHAFYQLTFPTADRTWVYDVSNGLWHERVWTDANGGEHRHRAQCATSAYGVNVVGDWENGNLYRFDPNNQTDNGSSIVRRRGFPHLLNEGKRLSYKQLLVSMATGNTGTTLTTNEPQVSLRMSHTGGNTWGNPRLLGMGSAGQYGRSMQARQLGMARDCVFELFWDDPYFTALNGLWVDAVAAQT